MDPPSIAIPEEGGKRCKISSWSPKGVELDGSTVDPIEMVVDVPGTSHGFTLWLIDGILMRKGQ